VLDPRTGKLTLHQTHISGASSAVVVPADGPPITAGNATAGTAPRTPVIEDWIGHNVLGDGRRYKAGIVVHDRRSGGRVGRHPRQGDGQVYIHSEGERLVIYDQGRDYVVKP
jgi:hypothetical protein